MSEDEAIKTLFTLRLNFDTDSAEDDALDTAISALEKRKLRRPYTHVVSYPYKQDETVVQCPACKRRLRTRRTQARGDRFCPDCGQAIDWEAIDG